MPTAKSVYIWYSDYFIIKLMDTSSL